MSPSFSLASIATVNPEPAYIVAAAAASVVSSEIFGGFQVLSPEDPGQIRTEGATVTTGSLNLINSFLDRILFNFLSSARSTSLASLRPAVVEVLKPRLAKEAIAGADDELSEYLGGDDEELNAIHNPGESRSDWDLDLVWKRTRLRCMLYTRLGDMEEEDEETYIAQEHLGDPDGDGANSVSPAVAIFLTAVLEFVGEQALMIAAHAACRRFETKARNEDQSSRTAQLVVEEPDMEKVALNSTLGRLWRSWRKSIRSPRVSVSRVSRETSGHRNLHSLTGNPISRKSSAGTAESFQVPQDTDHVASMAEVLDVPDPTQIPLPITEYDVAEIEVPGYNSQLAYRQKGKDGLRTSLRPFSALTPSFANRRSQMPPLPRNETVSSSQANPSKPASSPLPSRLRRSNSLPVQKTPFFTTSERGEDESEFETPLEEPTPDEGLVTELGPSQPSDQDVIASKTLEKRSSYMVPIKPNSAPTSPYASPFSGSVLDAISKHAARAYPDDDRSDIDPAEGVLQFDRNDYEVDESERAAVAVSDPRSSDSRLAASPPSPVTPKTFRKTVPPDVSPRSVSEELHGPGDISPVGHASIPSGEVSPIEPSDDEEEPSHKPGMAVDPPPAATAATAPLPAPGGVEQINSPLQNDQEPRDGEVVGSATSATSTSPMQGRQRRKKGPTEVDFAKDENREAFVVPEDLNVVARPPSAGSSLSGKDPQAEGTTKRRNVATADTTAAPNLTPLRELMESSPDASNEASLTPSQVEHRPRTTSLTSQPIVPVTRTSAATSKATDLRRQLPSVQTGTSTEKAAVQRVTPSPVTTSEITGKQSKSFENNARDPQPNSAVSVGRPASSVKSRSRRGTAPSETFLDTSLSRTSSEESRNAVESKYSRTSTNTGEVEKDFEQLMNSGETIQYTLTPQTMREIEVTLTEINRLSSTWLTCFQGGETPRSSTVLPPSSTGSVGRSGRVSIERSSPKQTKAGPASVRSSTRPSTSRSSNAASNTATGGSTFVIHSGPAVKRGPQAVPRDARVEADNTRDFADFIRSTGPEIAPSTSPASAVASRPSQSRGSIKAARKAPSVASSQQSTTRKVPSKTKTHLQARDPTIRGEGNSDLIDFIRQGPQADRTNGKNRVAPASMATQNTFNSDDFRGFGSTRSKDTPSVASTQDSFAAKSVQSSINSRTGLLDQTRANSKMPAKDVKPSRVEDSEMPARKQRRVRDPYAIDVDSEDEDMMATPKPQREEESLLDFLNSAPPPTMNNTPPPLDLSPSTINSLQRKRGGPSMRSHFALSNNQSDGAGGPSANAAKSSSPSRKLAPSARSQPLTNDASSSQRDGRDSPRLLKRKTGGFDSYGPAPQERRLNVGNGVGNDEVPRPNGIRTARKPMKARTAREDEGSTRDLADFLKNSGPLEPPPPPRAPIAKEEGSFARMFSRRKKNTAPA